MTTLISPDTDLSRIESLTDLQVAPEDRKTIRDLPDDPKRMPTIAAIAALELFGLARVEIAEVTGLSPEDVNNIAKLDSCKEFKQVVAMQSALQSQNDEVLNVLRRHAVNAVGVFVEALDSERPGVKMKAAQEVLDRGGYGAKQIVEQTTRNVKEERLIYEVVKRDVSQSVPMIDVTPD